MPPRTEESGRLRVPWSQSQSEPGGVSYVPRRLLQLCFFDADPPPCVEAVVEHNRSLLPHYEYRRFSRERFVEEVLDRSASVEERRCFRALRYAVAQADFARYLILYYVGGVYLDLKGKVNADLDRVVQRRETVLLHDDQTVPDTFTNFFLAFPPRHRTMRATIDVVMRNVRREQALPEAERTRGKDGVLRLTGPLAFSEAVHATRPPFVAFVKRAPFFEPGWQRGNFVEYDGTEGEYHRQMGAAHYSTFRDAVVAD